MRSLWIVALAALSLSVAAAQESRPAARLGDLPVPGFGTPSLPEEQFRQLHAAALPGGERERWAEIPWETDLAAAQQRAAREGKLLLLWVMDGHPLGCT